MFKYRVYISLTETKEIVDNFYWWNCTNYKKYTIEKIYKVVGACNLVLIPKDYRNEQPFVNACSWLVGTRFEL